MIDKGHNIIPPNTFHFDVYDVKKWSIYQRIQSISHIKYRRKLVGILPQKKVDEPETLSNISYDGNFSSAENIFSTRLCICTTGWPTSKWHFENLHLHMTIFLKIANICQMNSSFPNVSR